MPNHTMASIDCSRTTQGRSCCKYFDHFTSPQHIHGFCGGFRKSKINSFNWRHMGERDSHGCVRVGENRSSAPGVGRLLCSYHPSHLFINIMITQEKPCIFKPSVLIFIVLSAIYIWLAELWIWKPLGSPETLDSIMRFYNCCIWICFACCRMLRHWGFPLASCCANMVSKNILHKELHCVWVLPHTLCVNLIPHMVFTKSTNTARCIVMNAAFAGWMRTAELALLSEGAGLLASMCSCLLSVGSHLRQPNLPGWNILI